MSDSSSGEGATVARAARQTEHKSLIRSFKSKCPAARRSDGSQTIEPGDFEEGKRAAASIGDDAIQEMTEGSIPPGSWTRP